ncbi:DUF695 domain-containing protein [Pseudoxanthomonas sp. CF125]|uniref:DUF695 domain-containing protein n=1 Tax=Pseudoxanthomonas sp. CF125 TaxID=1855303 RepID=UPI000B8895D3|nr:DUF695 domain-containing protein [Pseudoxanthomonas sp. CF125]
MRLLLLFIALFTMPSAFAGKAMPLTIPNIVENDRWSLAEGTHNDKPLVIRFRDEFLNKPDLSSHPRLVRVVWSYQANTSGMPGSDASDQMGVFEDRLVAAVEPSQTAVLVAVLTNDGQREWLFYTPDVSEFGRRLTEMPQEKDRYPIDISTESDPEWSTFYDNILPGVAE